MVRDYQPEVFRLGEQKKETWRAEIGLRCKPLKHGDCNGGEASREFLMELKEDDGVRELKSSDSGRI